MVYTKHISVSTLVRREFKNLYYICVWRDPKTIARREQENKCIYGSKSNLDSNCFCGDEIVSGARLTVEKSHMDPLPLWCCM